MQTEIEVFADSEPITNDTRRHCHIFRSHTYEHVEVWVNDKLVFESEKEPTKEEIEAEKAYAKLGGVQ